MTQIPQSRGPLGAAGQGAQEGAAERRFEAILPEAPPRKPPYKVLVFLGAAMLVAVGGMIFCGGEPDKAEAKAPKLDVGSMSAEELAKDASPRAARELARRMARGTPSERASASSAVNCWTSPRLTRNLAMAMALEQQKRAQEMMRRVEAEQRMAEEGPPGGW